MPLLEILDRAATAPDTRDSILTDGQFTCTYAELPARLRELEHRIELNGIVADSCPAVECVNSLAGACLLLAFLRKNTSFILVPPSVTNEIKPTPRFCTHRITVGAALSPDGIPVIELNPDYNGKTVPRGKLFLRTSGSMGASKVVVHDHLKLIGNAENVVRKYDFRPASRAVIPVPIAHMYGFGAEFLPAILAGASIDLQEKTNVLKYLDREKKFQPTIAFVTPALCEMLSKAFKTPRVNYHVIVTSGQRISEELFRAFDPRINGRLINQYGSTEMGATAACDPGDSLDRRATTIGRPMDGVQISLAADQEGDGTGALLCRHPYGFEGYLDEAGEWLHRAEPEAWYCTGDVARKQADGSIVVMGRADASVNRSGYLVLLSDIERVMEKMETVGEVAVVAGKTEGKRGQSIAAFYVPRPGIELSGSQLRERCFDVLPHYAIPDEVRMIEHLPLLPSGKVDRQTLAALVEQ